LARCHQSKLRVLALGKKGDETTILRSPSHIHSIGPVQAASLYTAIDVGTLGGNLSVGRGINDAGQITGYSNTSSGTQHAFLYTNGQMTDLDPTGISSLGTAISNAGQVAGSFYLTARGPAHAFMYSNGRMNDLGP
jgi:probable HAF family extracellular repeat protein